MSTVFIDDTSLTNIADSIRTKLNVATTYKPSEMSAAIDSITSGITPTGTKQISITSNGTTTEDVTTYADAEITVNVPASTLGTKSITANGTYNAVDDSLDGYSSVTVNVSGGSGFTAVNMLEGVSFTPGYISSSGGITSASSSKEVYSDEVAITAGETYAFLYAFPQSYSGWFAFAYYDSSHTFLSRKVLTAAGYSPGVVSDTAPTGAAYIRVTFRSFGNAACSLSKYYDFYQFMVDANASSITS